MEAENFQRELKEALEEYRFRDVRSLIDGMDPTRFSESEAIGVVGQIRTKRLFPELETAAGTFLMAGFDSPELRVYHAQALLDQGRLYAGLSELRRLEPSVSGHESIGPEVRGLIGRAHKQQFADHDDHEALVDAIEAYEVDAKQAPGRHRWHAINLVACVARAEREGIHTERREAVQALAAKLLDAVGAETAPAVWDMATAMEAAVYLEDKPLALGWLKRYATDPGADAFELASTVRQLVEIWRLRGTDLGNAILPVIEYELLQRQGGTTGLQSVSPEKTGFEAVYGSEASKSMEWLDNMQSHCKSIARVHEDGSGRPVGTGFLAKGSWFKDEWGDDLVFVTNSHVVSETPDSKSLMPEDAVAEFTRLEGRPRVPLGEVLYSSPPEKLDISVLRIEPRADVAAIRITAYTPSAAVDEDAARVYVAGHPAGRDLEVTLYDNRLREVVDPYALYRCPTEGGNSGSPVFNGTWKAFALHHRADAAKQLNEGVLFAAIREETKALRGASAPQ